jgi:hypothetical protein
MRLLAATFCVFATSASAFDNPLPSCRVSAPPCVMDSPRAGDAQSDLETLSRQIFPMASQESQRLLWLYEAQQRQADRDRGNSATVTVRVPRF